MIVTGATGFVGANLVRRLLSDGCEVHVFVRPGCHLWRIQDILDDLRIHWIDVEDAEGVAENVALVKPDWVFHLAVYGAYPYQTDLNRMLSTNIIGTANMVQAALRTGFESFVNTGSSSEYGPKDHPASEFEVLEPNSNYAITKASASMLCRYTGQREGVGIRTLRLFSVFGPWEEPSRLVPTLIVAAFQRRLPPLASPATARDYVYADDVVDAYLLAASVPGQEPGAVYNVGTGRQTNLSEVVEIARQQLDLDTEPVWGSMPDRIWDTDVWVADNRSIRHTLGWSPRWEVADGFRLFAEWIQSTSSVLTLYIHPVQATA